MTAKLNLFERFANWATKATGSAMAFMLAVAIILVWGIS
ncbi:MAG: low affinity iron permease family protein, partial [Sphingobacteriaceae bacterium]